MKVSVVVPVYNPGHLIDECLSSLGGQSLPASDYEVIFADDGSTDGTGARLDEVADAHANIQVVRLPHSGGPGGPRNIGLDLARGEYVFFLDCDDWLAPEALERMYGFAIANDSDVLVGKAAGVNRAVPREAFRVNRPRADVLHDHLLQSLGPNKLFRRAFLEEHRIRFPEGPVRLEDHAFVITAYLRAKVISVLSDYACCYSRGHGSQLIAQRFDPVGYFDSVRSVLDIVDAHTEPGTQRDGLYTHWYRGKLLKRMGGGVLLSYEPAYRHALFAEIRRLALERFSPELDRRLPAHLRVRAGLLRAGRLDRLTSLAEAERGIRAAISLDEVRWDEGVLVMNLTGELTYVSGKPLLFRSDGERLLWDPPLEDMGGHDVTSGVRALELDVSLRHRDNRGEFFVPISRRVTLEPVPGDEGLVRARVIGEARVDVGSAKLGLPLEAGIWDVSARVSGCGWYGQARLGGNRSPQAARGCSGVLADYPKRLVVPYWTSEGQLSVCVEPASFAETVALASPASEATRRDRHVIIGVPVPYVPPSGGPIAELVLRASGRTVTIPALIEAGLPGRLPGRLVAKVPVRRAPVDGCVGRGLWLAAFAADCEETPLEFALRIGARGRPTVLTLREALTSRELAVRWARRVGGHILRRFPALRPLVDRLRVNRPSAEGS